MNLKRDHSQNFGLRPDSLSDFGPTASNQDGYPSGPSTLLGALNLSKGFDLRLPRFRLGILCLATVSKMPPPQAA
jgi:hypothetical protein